MKATFESRGIPESQLALVEEIKQKASDLEDTILKALDNKSETEGVGPEVPRYVAMARTNLEMSVMCAVKAVSRR